MTGWEDLNDYCDAEVERINKIWESDLKLIELLLSVEQGLSRTDDEFVYACREQLLGTGKIPEQKVLYDIQRARAKRIATRLDT